jgi:hypothetical protein
MASATLGSFATRSWTAFNRAAALGVGTLRGLLTVVATGTLTDDGDGTTGASGATTDLADNVPPRLSFTDDPSYVATVEHR